MESSNDFSLDKKSLLKLSNHLGLLKLLESKELNLEKEIKIKEIFDNILIIRIYTQMKLLLFEINPKNKSKPIKFIKDLDRIPKNRILFWKEKNQVYYS